MSTISKVKSVTLGKEWTSKHGGTFYNHDYEMEDGEKLQASHKTQTPFSVGDEVEYEITSTDEQYGNKGKVKKPDSGGGYSRSGGYDNLGQQIGNCISNACLLAAHGAIKIENLEATVHRLMDIGNSTKEKYKG